MLRSRHTIPLLALALIIGGMVVVQALVFQWMPPQASEQAESLQSIMWFVFWVSVVVYTLVTTVVVYSAIRFRAKPGDDGDGPPIHGNTKLEVVWTLVPALILGIVGVWAYLVLSDTEALAEDRIAVDVVGEQFAWTFRYPEQRIETGDLRLPVGRQVELRMRSRDVIHDLWIPEFYYKHDVVPGITTRVIYNPTRTGTFPIVCAELCGLGHNTMRAQVIVMEPAAYDAWLARAEQTVQQQQQGGGGDGGESGGPATDEEGDPETAGETPEGVDANPEANTESGSTP
jgi:cytochrome c oxidase subunit II